MLEAGVEIVTEVVGNVHLYCELIHDIVAGIKENPGVPEFRVAFEKPLEAQYACLKDLLEKASK